MKEFLKKTSEVLLLSFVLLFFSCSADRTPQQQQIVDNTTVLKEWSTIDSFVKGKQIIILGEAGHGDGTTFEKKAELVEYLQKNHGFKTLAFEFVSFGEDNWLSTNKACGNTYSMTSIYHPKFYASEEMQGLIKLIDSGSMNLWGLESFCWKSDWLIDQIKDFKAEALPPPTHCLDNLKDILSRAKEYVILAPDTLRFDENTKCVLDFLQNIAKQKTLSMEEKYKCEYLMQVFTSMATGIKHAFAMLYEGNNFETLNIALQLRDKQMAENLIWYLKHHPEEKVIVNCASFHGARALSPLIHPTYPVDFYATYLPMGYFLSEYLKDKMLTIAFTSYEGSVCTKFENNTQINEPIPHYENTIEAILHKAYPRKDLLYLNLIPLRDSLLNINSSAFGTNIKGDWSKCFDAMIYLKEQRPITMKKKRDS